MSLEPGKKEKTHQKILESANRGFRKHGYSGAGVDSLASDAGVTSGAFYAHFGSKANAFRKTLAGGLSDVQELLSSVQDEHGSKWLDYFFDFYLNDKRTCDIEESCALQNLSSEVFRSDEETRKIYQTELLEIAKEFAKGLPNRNNKPRDLNDAWPYLAMLIGAVTLGRAVLDPKLSSNISKASEKGLQRLLQAEES